MNSPQPVNEFPIRAADVRTLRIVNWVLTGILVVLTFCLASWITLHIDQMRHLYSQMSKELPVLTQWLFSCPSSLFIVLAGIVSVLLLLKEFLPLPVTRLAINVLWLALLVAAFLFVQFILNQPMFCMLQSV